MLPTEIRGVGSSGAGVMGGCKLPCRCWKLNLGVLHGVSIVVMSHHNQGKLGGKGLLGVYFHITVH